MSWIWHKTIWWWDSGLVVYWPPTLPNMPFQIRWKCIFHWRGRAWLTICDRVKIPRYNHRLMHRKRVTCELHDSYFCLMTIKHAIPKTAGVTHSDGQLWEILSGRLNYYIIRWRQEVSWFVDRRFWRRDVVEKASSQQRAGPPGLRSSNPRERERHNADGLESGDQHVAVLFGLQLPLTHNPFK